MTLSLPRGLRFSVGILISLFLITGCPVSPPPGGDSGNGGSGVGDGPPFGILSPAAGASIAGPVFFAIQATDPGAVESVTFSAGDAEIVPQYEGENAFRVFLMPEDLPDGPLTLRATVRGSDGGTSRASIDVTVVREPPGSATVGATGAVLGARESNGSTSVLSIPAGSAEGADVNFNARTQSQVKQATGVDYEAMGVTFLGAQEIATSRPIDPPLMVSSGGFGPMVQPGQAVVNYIITPDANGDGVGELVVANTASVAPNGDVIADPVPDVTLRPEVEVERSYGSTTTQQLGSRSIQAPPGAILTFTGTYFAPADLLGNIAVFESHADGMMIELPLLLSDARLIAVPCPARGNLAAQQAPCGDLVPEYEMQVIVPPLEAGPATIYVGRKTMDSDLGALRTFDLSVEATPVLAEPPEQIVDEFFDVLEEAVAVLMEAESTGMYEGPVPTADLPQHIATIRGYYDLLLQEAHSAVPGSLKPQSLKVLEHIFKATRFVSSGGGCGALATGDGIGSHQTAIDAAKCLGTAGLVASSAVFIGSALFLVPATTPFMAVAFAAAMAAKVSTGFTIASAAAYVGLATVAVGSGGASTTTGMGSVMISGGPGAGTVDPPATASGMDLRTTADGSSSLDAWDMEPGRFAVHVFVGGSPIPFTGLSTSTGYFMIPIVPADQPYTAIARDTHTGATREFSGIGPALDDATFMYFDFFSEGEDTVPHVSLDSNLTGRLEAGGQDFYAFSGDEGDIVRLALHTIERNLGVVVTLVGPSGDIIDATDRRAQYDTYHLLPERALPESGTYTVAVGNGTAEPMDYTLGLARIDEPVPVAPGEDGVVIADEITVVGDIHYYGFDADPADAAKVTVRIPSASSLRSHSYIGRPPDGRAIQGYQAHARPEVPVESYGPVPLTDGGRYVMAVMAQEGAVSSSTEDYLGAYEVTLRKPEATHRPVPSNTTGFLDAGDLDVIKYDGQAGDVVTIAAMREPVQGGNAFQWTLERLTAGGGFFRRTINGGDTYGYESLGETTLGATGSHTVVVHSVDAAAAGYTLGIAPVDPPSAIALTPPLTILEGGVEIIGEVSTFHFEGIEGEEHTLTLSHEPGEELFATAQLFSTTATGERQQLLGSVSTNAARRSHSMTVTLPQSNTFLIVVAPASVSGSEGQFTGTYRMTLESP